jgi:outer membrane protein TolC
LWTAFCDARQNSVCERRGIKQLVAQATQSLDLSQARYNLGLSAIVDLTRRN